MGTRKRSRIRTAAGYWAEGYVRVFLHRPNCDCAKEVPNRICKHWYLPKPAMSIFDQMLRVDAVGHDDYADAASDVFIEHLPGRDRGLWRRPNYLLPNMPAVEGAVPIGPESSWIKDDERLFGKDLAQQVNEAELAWARVLGPGHGPDDGMMPPREPV